MRSLSLELSNHQALREDLVKRWPALDDDEDALADTLEGISTLPDTVAAMLRSALEDELLADGLAEHIARLQARKKRILERSGRKRALALWACQEGNLTRITAPDLTASISQGKGHVVIHDPNMLTDAWVRIKREPDKEKIGAALRAGLLVDGATLSNPAPVLVVRVG